MFKTTETSICVYIVCVCVCVCVPMTEYHTIALTLNEQYYPIVLTCRVCILINAHLNIRSNVGTVRPVYENECGIDI